MFVGGQIPDNKVNNNMSISHQSCLFQVKYKDACSMHTHTYPLTHAILQK